MKKFALLAAAIAVAPSLAFGTQVLATSPGQLGTGPDLYQVRNVTKNGTYASTATATCGDVLKYSVKLSNTQYGQLSNVTLKASLANGTMTASATNASGETTSVSGNVSVSVDKGSQKYVGGSTVNLDVNGGHIKTLADGITANGTDKGSLAGSTREFVQFQTKVECETPEVPGKITVCEVATKKTITINEKDFDAKKHSKDLDDCGEVLGETPAVIASTGPTSGIATMAGLSAVAAGIGYFVQRRRNILG